MKVSERKVYTNSHGQHLHQEYDCFCMGACFYFREEWWIRNLPSIVWTRRCFSIFISLSGDGHSLLVLNYGGMWWKKTPKTSKQQFVGASGQDRNHASKIHFFEISTLRIFSSERTCSVHQESLKWNFYANYHSGLKMPITSRFQCRLMFRPLYPLYLWSSWGYFCWPGMYCSGCGFSFYYCLDVPPSWRPIGTNLNGWKLKVKIP